MTIRDVILYIKFNNLIRQDLKVVMGMGTAGKRQGGRLKFGGLGSSPPPPPPVLTSLINTTARAAK